MRTGPSSGGFHLDFRIGRVSKVFFFPTSRLTENSSVFSEIGTEFMHLLRTDFSVSESGKFSGMATTVLRFAGDESLVV